MAERRQKKERTETEESEQQKAETETEKTPVTQRQIHSRSNHNIKTEITEKGISSGTRQCKGSWKLQRSDPETTK